MGKCHFLLVINLLAAGEAELRALSAEVADGNSGWSTTLLNSIGVLYLVGNFDGLTFHGTGDTEIKQLVFPAGYPPTTSSRYEPSTAIREFSTGRNHVLGLADDGKVWYWAQAEARQIKLSNVDMTARNVVRAVAGELYETSNDLAPSRGNTVLGWDRCSLYIKGTGIVYWPPPSDWMEPTEDTLLIEPTIIPGTGHIHNSDERTSGSDLASQIGEVSNHIVLEAYVVFTTRLNKVFAWSTSSEAEVSQLRPFELTTFYPSNPATTFNIRDIQGSFRSFAVFTTSGAVLTAYRPLLDAFFYASTAESPSSDPLPHPSYIASLQNQSVTSLAFGDYHVHALHDDGTISSFGRDPQNQGAFGLGNAIFAMFRGMQSDLRSWDGSLDGRKRRTIWFEPLMETRIEYLLKPDQEGEVAREEDSRRRVLNDNQLRDKYGDYFEAEGRRWEDGVTAESEMGAYFALKVAAAGWHSAALVLVDEEKAERARQKHVVPASVRSAVRADEGVWSSLLNAVVWSLEPLYLFGRWLMGFFVVRSMLKNDDDRISREGKRKEAERVRYVWENQPLPRLWDVDGWSGMPRRDNAI